MKVQRLNLSGEKKTQIETPTLQYGSLIGALMGWCLILYILLSIEPKSIQDVIFVNSYLPLMVVFFITNFFTWKIVLQHTRRSTLLTLFLCLLLLFKLNQLLNPFGFLLITIPLLLSEVMLTFLTKK